MSTYTSEIHPSKSLCGGTIPGSCSSFIKENNINNKLHISDIYINLQFSCTSMPFSLLEKVSTSHT